MKISFYCKNCKLDQDLIPRKDYTAVISFLGGKSVEEATVDEMQVRWIETGKFIAKCERCGKNLHRYYGENKARDPYYFDSKKVRIERDKFARDLIQPGEDGFKMFYKKQWDELEKQKEEHERKISMGKKERENYYRQALKDGADGKAVRKMLELEEQNV